MTTLVYEHSTRTIAADGRETDHNGFICCDATTKIYHTPNGDVLAGAGPTSIIDYVVKHWTIGNGFEDDMELADKLQSTECQHAAFFLYRKATDTVYEYHVQLEDDPNGPHPVHVYEVALAYNYALGSGATLAIAAMDFGCNCVGAIEYAMTRDSNTGGRTEKWSPNSALKTSVDDASQHDHLV